MASGSQNNTTYQAQKWTNLRAFTIGDTAKNVDGTTAVSWSKDEILGASTDAYFLRGDKAWSNTLNGVLLLPKGLKTGSRVSDSGSGIVIDNDGGIEIFHTSTPFIDFHYQASTADYSVRLLCDSATNIHDSGSFTTGKYITANGNITANGGYLYSTLNGNTVQIGSQNGSYAHFTNTKDIPFWFNKVIQSDGGFTIYNTGDNHWRNGYIKINNSGGGDCYVELRRAANADWRMLNSGGHLYFQSNWTSAKGSYYNVLQLEYNSGNINVLRGNISISHATSADMAHSSTNPKITFSESGGQPVHLIYTDYDSYRSPAGLKVVGGASASPAWFEVEGSLYLGAPGATGTGIYWNPYVESATDASDAGSIYQIKAGVAGGTELRISQLNDATDCINLCTNSYIYFNSKKAFTISDSWLRINDAGGFSSGIYCGTSILRTDGTLQVGSSGSNFYANNSGHVYIKSTLSIATDSTSYNLYVNGSTYFKGNTTHNGIDYFANGTTYYIDNSAVAYLNDLRSDKVRLVDDWVGFYQTANASNHRYGYIQANANRMYFRKENGVSTYGFDFNSHLYTTGHYYSSNTGPCLNIACSDLTNVKDAKNGLSANREQGMVCYSKDYGSWMGDFKQGYTQSNGQIWSRMYLRNYKTDGTQVNNYIYLYSNKDGTTSYAVANAAAFRSAIGAGTSSLTIGTTSSTAAAGNHNHDSTYVNVSGDTMTGSLTVNGINVNNNNITGINCLKFNDAAENFNEGIMFPNGSAFDCMAALNGAFYFRCGTDGTPAVNSTNANGKVYAANFYGYFNGNCSGSAGSVAWGNVSSKPATATRWPSWSEVTSKPAVQNNLTSTSTTDMLSAAQGKALNDNKTAKGTGLAYTTLLNQTYSGTSFKSITVSNISSYNALHFACYFPNWWRGSMLIPVSEFKSHGVTIFFMINNSTPEYANFKYISDTSIQISTDNGHSLVFRIWGAKTS